MDLLTADFLQGINAQEIQSTNGVTVIRIVSWHQPSRSYDISLYQLANRYHVRLDTGISAKPVIPAKQRLADSGIDWAKVYAGHYVISRSYPVRKLTRSRLKTVILLMIRLADNLHTRLGVTS